jgi:lipoprotein signal peptidase
MNRRRYLKYISLFVSLFNLFLSIYLSNIGRCNFNQGIAFGIDITYEIWISMLTILFLFGISLKIKNEFKEYLLSIGILGVGNLIVRVIYGQICDYIPFFNLSINLVDILIVTLSILAPLEMILKPKT